MPIAIVGIIGHLIQYYTILDKISDKIKKKRNQKINEVEHEINHDLEPARIISLHNQIHNIDNYYDDLESNVYGNFYAGTALFVLSGIGITRNFFSFVTQDVVTIIIFCMIIAGAFFSITLWKLLHWNLKNK